MKIYGFPIGIVSLEREGWIQWVGAHFTYTVKTYRIERTPVNVKFIREHKLPFGVVLMSVVVVGRFRCVGIDEPEVAWHRGHLPRTIDTTYIVTAQVGWLMSVKI
jgi:hypothetical protein